MSFKYERYLTRVSRQPFCILPEKLAEIWDLMRLRASGHRLTDEDIAERLADSSGQQTPRASGPRSDGNVAVIPIVGTIAHRADSFEASSGGTSTQRIGTFLKRAVADDSVKSILLDINSPGGSVEGVPELAAQIAAAREVKPVIAVSNALAASAAYWLASQATEIVVTPSGMVGSIGVFLLLTDESAFLEQAGVKINAISAGDHKLEGAPWQELSPESKAFLQGQVDSVYADFLKAVAVGRGVPVARVKSEYGQGRVYDATDALARGMVDRVATFEDTLARMVKAKSVGGLRMRGAAVAFADSVAAAIEASDVAPGVEIFTTVATGTDNTISVYTSTGNPPRLTMADEPTPEEVPAEPTVDVAAADRDQAEMRLTIARLRQGAA